MKQTKIELNSGKVINVISVRIDDKMYSYYGHCSYDNCLLEEDLLDNHLYCKYHGCIYHPQTGHIQEGPSMYSLQPLQLDRLQHTDNNHLYMLHLPD